MTYRTLLQCHSSYYHTMWCSETNVEYTEVKTKFLLCLLYIVLLDCFVSDAVVWE